MDTTPTWGIQYQEYGDSADIAAALQGLATTMDTAVTTVDARVARDVNEPSARASTLVAQSIPNNVETTVTYPVGSETYDNNGMIDLAVSTSRITFPSELGVYRLVGNVEFATNFTGHRRLTLTHSLLGNVARHVQNAIVVAGVVLTVVQIVPVTVVGQFCTLTVIQTSGGALNIVNRKFQATRLRRL